MKRISRKGKCTYLTPISMRREYKIVVFLSHGHGKMLFRIQIVCLFFFCMPLIIYNSIYIFIMYSDCSPVIRDAQHCLRTQ